MESIMNEEKKDIFINLTSLPSAIMVIVEVLNIIKNNKNFIKLIKKYIKDDYIIYLFDEANITYSENISIVPVEFNILSQIVLILLLYLPISLYENTLPYLSDLY